MEQFTTSSATSSRVVKHVRNGLGSKWQSTLYVNGGETATTIRASHKTIKGARMFARSQLLVRA